MSRGKFEGTASKRFSMVKLFLCILAIILLIVLVYSCNSFISRQSPAATEPTVIKNPDSIAIPGYEMLELKADSKTQTICLANPPQNDCYFKISLYLEDGTLLWQSELIEPGKTSKAMVLTTALKKGTYSNAVLLYSCFRMDEALSPLNGAQMKVTLWVK